MAEYKSLLLSKEWQHKRQIIIERDGKKCTQCNNENLLNNCYIGVVHFNNKYHHPSYKTDHLFKLKIIDYKSNELLEKDIGVEHLNLNMDKVYVVYYLPKWNNPSPSSDIDVFFNFVADSSIMAIRVIDGFELLKEPIKDDFASFLCGEDVYRLNGYISEKTFKAIYSKDYPSFIWIKTFRLHVHHTYYQEGKDPWEYPDISLKTFCWLCHEKFHSQQKVPYLNRDGLKIGEVTPCSRCSGAGVFPEYNYIEQGICFRCRGAKYEEFIK